jgi:hypothetical protein
VDEWNGYLRNPRFVNPPSLLTALLNPAWVFACRSDRAGNSSAGIPQTALATSVTCEILALGIQPAL